MAPALRRSTCLPHLRQARCVSSACGPVRGPGYRRRIAAAANSQPADPLARGAAIAIACGRIGIGIGAFGLTRKALAGLGFDRPDGTSVALARLAGSRDIALGLHALGAVSGGDRERLREATLLGALVDGADALSFGAALISRDGIDRTALINAPLATGAALAGAWALSRL